MPDDDVLSFADALADARTHDGPPEMQRHRARARDEPLGRGRPDRTHGQRVLRAPRDPAEDARELDWQGQERASRV